MVVFDENDPKYRVACCCRAHVRTVSLGCVYFILLLSFIALVQAGIRLPTTYSNDEKFVACFLLIVSVVTIGAATTWLWAVRSGRWSLMMIMHGTVAAWAVVCLGFAVLFGFALATGPEGFMVMVIRLVLGRVEYWAERMPETTCLFFCCFFVALTIFLSWSLYVLLTYHGYLIAQYEAKKVPSWKIGRTSISLHTVAQLPDDQHVIKDIPFVFAKSPLY